MKSSGLLVLFLISAAEQEALVRIGPPAPGDRPALLRILQAIDAAPSDDHLFHVTLRLLKSICACMHQTLKQRENTKFNDSNTLQEDEQETRVKDLDLYKNMYNNTCVNLRQELLKKVTNSQNVSVLSEDSSMNMSECGNRIDITTESVIRASTNTAPVLQRSNKTNLENVIFKTLIETKDYHKYNIRRYSLFGKAREHLHSSSKHSIIVIVTLHPMRSVTSEVPFTRRRLHHIDLSAINSTLYSHAPIDIDIIDAQYDAGDRNNKYSFSECMLQSIYSFLIESEKKNMTKVFKLLPKNDKIKIYIEVIAAKNHTDYSQICCKGSLMSSLCRIDLKKKLTETEEESHEATANKKPRKDISNFKKTISTIKDLLKTYDEKLRLIEKRTKINDIVMNKTQPRWTIKPDCASSRITSQERLCNNDTDKSATFPKLSMSSSFSATKLKDKSTNLSVVAMKPIHTFLNEDKFNLMSREITVIEPNTKDEVRKLKSLNNLFQIEDVEPSSEKHDTEQIIKVTTNSSQKLETNTPMNQVKTKYFKSNTGTVSSFETAKIDKEFVALYSAVIKNTKLTDPNLNTTLPLFSGENPSIEDLENLITKAFATNTEKPKTDFELHSNTTVNCGIVENEKNQNYSKAMVFRNYSTSINPFLKHSAQSTDILKNNGKPIKITTISSTESDELSNFLEEKVNLDGFINKSFDENFNKEDFTIVNGKLKNKLRVISEETTIDTSCETKSPIICKYSNKSVSKVINKSENPSINNISEATNFSQKRDILSFEFKNIAPEQSKTTSTVLYSEKSMPLVENKQRLSAAVDKIVITDSITTDKKLFTEEAITLSLFGKPKPQSPVPQNLDSRTAKLAWAASDGTDISETPLEINKRQSEESTYSPGEIPSDTALIQLCKKQTLHTGKAKKNSLKTTPLMSSIDTTKIKEWNTHYSTTDPVIDVKILSRQSNTYSNLESTSNEVHNESAIIDEIGTTSMELDTTIRPIQTSAAQEEKLEFDSNKPWLTTSFTIKPSLITGTKIINTEVKEPNIKYLSNFIKATIPVNKDKSKKIKYDKRLKLFHRFVKKGLTDGLEIADRPVYNNIVKYSLEKDFIDTKNMLTIASQGTTSSQSQETLITNPTTLQREIKEMQMPLGKISKYVKYSKQKPIQLSENKPKMIIFTTETYKSLKTISDDANKIENVSKHDPTATHSEKTQIRASEIENPVEWSKETINDNDQNDNSEYRLQLPVQIKQERTPEHLITYLVLTPQNIADVKMMSTSKHTGNVSTNKYSKNTILEEIKATTSLTNRQKPTIQVKSHHNIMSFANSANTIKQTTNSLMKVSPRAKESDYMYADRYSTHSIVASEITNSSTAPSIKSTIQALKNRTVQLSTPFSRTKKNNKEKGIFFHEIVGINEKLSKLPLNMTKARIRIIEGKESNEHPSAETFTISAVLFDNEELQNLSLIKEPKILSLRQYAISPITGTAANDTNKDYKTILHSVTKDFLSLNLTDTVNKTLTPIKVFNNKLYNISRTQFELNYKMDSTAVFKEKESVNGVPSYASTLIQLNQQVPQLNELYYTNSKFTTKNDFSSNDTEHLIARNFSTGRPQREPDKSSNNTVPNFNVHENEENSVEERIAFQRVTNSSSYIYKLNMNNTISNHLITKPQEPFSRSTSKYPKIESMTTSYVSIYKKDNSDLKIKANLKLNTVLEDFNKSEHIYQRFHKSENISHDPRTESKSRYYTIFPTSPTINKEEEKPTQNPFKSNLIPNQNYDQHFETQASLSLHTSNSAYIFPTIESMYLTNYTTQKIPNRTIEAPGLLETRMSKTNSTQISLPNQTLNQPKILFAQHTSDFQARFQPSVKSGKVKNKVENLINYLPHFGEKSKASLDIANQIDKVNLEKTTIKYKNTENYQNHVLTPNAETVTVFLMQLQEKYDKESSILSSKFESTQSGLFVPIPNIIPILTEFTTPNSVISKEKTRDTTETEFKTNKFKITTKKQNLPVRVDLATNKTTPIDLKNSKVTRKMHRTTDFSDANLKTTPISINDDTKTDSKYGNTKSPPKVTKNHKTAKSEKLLHGVKDEIEKTSIKNAVSIEENTLGTNSYHQKDNKLKFINVKINLTGSSNTGPPVVSRFGKVYFRVPSILNNEINTKETNLTEYIGTHVTSVKSDENKIEIPKLKIASSIISNITTSESKTDDTYDPKINLSSHNDIEMKFSTDLHKNTSFTPYDENKTTSSVTNPSLEHTTAIIIQKQINRHSSSIQMTTTIVTGKIGIKAETNTNSILGTELIGSNIKISSIGTSHTKAKQNSTTYSTSPLTPKGTSLASVVKTVKSRTADNKKKWNSIRSTRKSDIVSGGASKLKHSSTVRPTSLTFSKKRKTVAYNTYEPTLEDELFEFEITTVSDHIPYVKTTVDAAQNREKETTLQVKHTASCASLKNRVFKTITDLAKKLKAENCTENIIIVNEDEIRFQRETSVEKTRTKPISCTSKYTRVSENVKKVVYPKRKTTKAYIPKTKTTHRPQTIKSTVNASVIKNVSEKCNVNTGKCHKFTASTAWKTITPTQTHQKIIVYSSRKTTEPSRVFRTKGRETARTTPLLKATQKKKSMSSSLRPLLNLYKKQSISIVPKTITPTQTVGKSTIHYIEKRTTLSNIIKTIGKEKTKTTPYEKATTSDLPNRMQSLSSILPGLFQKSYNNAEIKSDARKSHSIPKNSIFMHNFKGVTEAFRSDKIDDFGVAEAMNNFFTDNVKKYSTFYMDKNAKRPDKKPLAELFTGVTKAKANIKKSDEDLKNTNLYPVKVLPQDTRNSYLDQLHLANKLKDILTNKQELFSQKGFVTPRNLLREIPKVHPQTLVLHRPLSQAARQVVLRPNFNGMDAKHDLRYYQPLFQSSTVDKKENLAYKREHDNIFGVENFPQPTSASALEQSFYKKLPSLFSAPVIPLPWKMRPNPNILSTILKKKKERSSEERLIEDVVDKPSLWERMNSVRSNLYEVDYLKTTRQSTQEKKYFLGPVYDVSEVELDPIRMSSFFQRSHGMTRQETPPAVASKAKKRSRRTIFFLSPTVPYNRYF